MSRLALAALVALTLHVVADHALACSCMPPTHTRRVLPADGATELPTDTIFRVFLQALSEHARNAVAQEYRLKDAAGGLVPLHARVVHTRVDIVPHAPLAPERSYVLEQLVAYDETGAQLTDTERASVGSVVRAAWYPVARYTTGTGPSTRRALRPEVTHAELSVRWGGGDCGPATSLYVRLATPPNALATDVVELRVVGQGVVATAPLEGLDALDAGDALCAVDPITLVAGRSIRFEVVHLDAAGHPLGLARGVASTRLRRPASRAFDSGSEWRPPTIVPTPSSSPHGPAACVHGLEPVQRRPVVRASQAPIHAASLRASPSTAWLFVPGTATRALRVFSVSRGAPRAHEHTEELRVHASAATPSGPLLVVGRSSERDVVRVGRPRDPESPEPTELRAYTPGLRPRWTRTIPTTGDYALATGDGHVLVAFTEPHDGARRIVYGSFDEATGAGELHTTDVVLESPGAGPEVAFASGRFFLFWRTHGGVPVRMAPVEAQGLGVAREIPVDASSSFTIASTGDHLGFAGASRDGDIHFVALDPEGRPHAPPVWLSRGVGGRDNKRPHIAWTGAFFAVAWNTFPAHGDFVTAVDLRGRASWPTRLDDEGEFGLIGIAATDRELWAARAPRRADLSLLRLNCRATPTSGPPPTIDPIDPSTLPPSPPSDDIIPEDRRQRRNPYAD